MTEIITPHHIEKISLPGGNAQGNGFDCFSTILLSSPYQKHELVKEIVEKFGQGSRVEFIYQDFRPKFYDGVTQIRALRLLSPEILWL